MLHHEIENQEITLFYVDAWDGGGGSKTTSP